MQSLFKKILLWLLDKAYVQLDEDVAAAKERFDQKQKEAEEEVATAREKFNLIVKEGIEIQSKIEYVLLRNKSLSEDLQAVKNRNAVINQEIQQLRDEQERIKEKHRLERQRIDNLSDDDALFASLPRGTTD